MGSTVKKGIENFLYFSHQPIVIVGGINITGVASGSLDLTYPGASSLPGSGHVLLVIADLASQSDTDTVLSIIGTDPADVAQTGSVTMPKRAARTYAAKVDVAADADDLFKTVTSVVVSSGGVAGDLYVILGIPEYSRVLDPATTLWNYIPFFDGLDIDIGAGQEAIFDHYEPDHSKRTRLDNSITLTARYVDVETGLMLVDGAEISLRIETRPDGRSLINEQQFIAKAKVSAAPSIPEGEGIVTITAEGNFSKIARELLVSNQ